MSNIHKIHGILNIFAISLFTFGVIIAFIRELIGEKWFIIHITSQLCATLILTISIILVIYTSTNKNKPDPKTKIGRHKILGKILLSLIYFQILFAFIGKRLLDRNIWVILHTIIASIILILGWIQIYLIIK